GEGQRSPALALQVGQAPQPCTAWTFLAISICCSRVAWSAVGAYWPPPKAFQVDGVNCRPPWKPLPVLIDQSPVDSQWAMVSQTPCGSCGASLVPTRTVAGLPGSWMSSSMIS